MSEKNSAQTISKDEFAKAMELREKDFQLQKMSIDHDKQRLAIIEKQCDTQNRRTELLERVTSLPFLWQVASVIASCVVLCALAIRLTAIV